MEITNSNELNAKPSHGSPIRRIDTADTITLPRDVFESLYLNPERRVTGDLRSRFGNPTPAALIGFVMASTPYACAVMGWRGAGGNGGAVLNVLIYFGGMLQIIGAVLEWILGNTFSMALFFTYGSFWLVVGTNLEPLYAGGANYSPTGNSLQGMTTPGYYATFGFYYLSLTLLTAIFTVCSVRTNIVFVSALALLVFAFACGTGAMFNLALGKAELAAKLTKASGALEFVLTMIIWYILAVQLLECVDFPYRLPVGDLSRVILGRTERLKKIKAAEEV